MSEKKGFNRLEQGLNTKVYMAALIAALLILIAGLYFFVAVRGRKVVPNVDRPGPGSRLVMPATPGSPAMPSVA